MPMRKSPPQLRSLTPNEKRVLEYIEEYFTSNGYSPAYSEIKEHFQFASFNSVQRYLKQLEDKGYIHIPGENQKRAIQLLHSSRTLLDRSPLTNSSPHPRAGTATSLPVPLLGLVAAGAPIEALSYDEAVDVPLTLVRTPEETYALKVKGQSMIEDGIFEGDIVLVQKQNHARSGEIVVAMINNEATVKRVYWPKSGGRAEVELRPANASMESMWYHPSQVEVHGVVVGLIRRY
jgi:repressor LexA